MYNREKGELWMQKVDHVGIAVKSIDVSIDYYIHTLGLNTIGH